MTELLARRRVLASGVVLVLVAIALLVRVLGDGSEELGPDRGADSSLAQDVRPIGTPTRLQIDALGVDAPVIEVGTAPDNSQEVPGPLDVTGWWRDGAVPGAPGHAVIVGHNAAFDDGVFDDLAKLDEGDTFVVHGADGSLQYTVTETRSIDDADFAEHAAEIYRADGPTGVVLMTCDNLEGQQFAKTAIVFAVPS